MMIISRQPDDATGNQGVITPETFATRDTNSEPREERYSNEQSLEHPLTARDSRSSPPYATQFPHQIRQIPEKVESVELGKSMDLEILGKCDEPLKDAGNAVRIPRFASHRRKRALHPKKETEQDPPPKRRRLPRRKHPAVGQLTDSESTPKSIPSPSRTATVIPSQPQKVVYISKMTVITL
jgi:hypothetical protein